MIVDAFDGLFEPTRDAASLAPATGLAVHPSVAGRPSRLQRLRRALEPISVARDDGRLRTGTPAAHPVDAIAGMIGPG